MRHKSTDSVGAFFIVFPCEWRKLIQFRSFHYEERALLMNSPTRIGIVPKTTSKLPTQTKNALINFMTHTKEDQHSHEIIICDYIIGVKRVNGILSKH